MLRRNTIIDTQATKKLEQLIATLPQFHTMPDGTPTSWAMAGGFLHTLANHLKPEMITLEIGSGYSTVVFALAGTHHTVITPSDKEPVAIKKWCTENEIDTSNLTFIIGSSDQVLPAGDNIPDQIDLVLIDGAHRFPYPIIDWHFTQHRLRLGGLMLVDDFMIPSIGMLHNFLLTEKYWQLEEVVHLYFKTSFFRKIAVPVYTLDWVGQAINADAANSLSSN